MDKETEDKIVNLYIAGAKLKDIAPVVGFSAVYVGQILKRLGYDRPAKPQKERRTFGPGADEDKIIALWNGGLSASAIAERLRIQKNGVYQVLRRNGIERDYRHRMDGEGGAIDRSGGAFARIARKT